MFSYISGSTETEIYTYIFIYLFVYLLVAQHLASGKYSILIFGMRTSSKLNKKYSNEDRIVETTQ